MPFADSAANLLISKTGELKIADFGLSRSYDTDYRVPMTNLVVTRWYRPPELLMGEKRYTESIDVWGAGCVCRLSSFRNLAFFYCLSFQFFFAVRLNCANC